MIYKVETEKGQIEVKAGSELELRSFLKKHFKEYTILTKGKKGGRVGVIIEAVENLKQNPDQDFYIENDDYSAIYEQVVKYFGRKNVSIHKCGTGHVITKNPDYLLVQYREAMKGLETISTVPELLEAFERNYYIKSTLSRATLHRHLSGKAKIHNVDGFWLIQKNDVHDSLAQ